MMFDVFYKEISFIKCVIQFPHLKVLSGTQGHELKTRASLQKTRASLR
jgi:hypothetical protein